MVRTVIPLGLTATCLLLSPAAGCRPRPADDEASIQKSLREKRTLDVMDQVSKAPDFRPPADSLLSEAQVKMYLAVRARERKIRQAMSAVGDLADVATADLRAAQELGYNPKEYRWVRDRVLEAQLLAATRNLHQQVAQGRQSLVRTLEAEKKRTMDAAERAKLDRQIQDLQNDSGAAPDSDPAKKLNARLLAKLRAISQDGGQ